MRTGYRSIICMVLVFVATSTAAQVRLKDVASIKDQRSTQIMGYGLVVGLDGTGDNRNTQFTIRTIANMLKRMHINVPATTIKVKNVAAVMVTATVSPYVKKGSPFDVNVSSLGDASSLQGGTLLMAPLVAADGTVYGTAQGMVTIGGANKDYGSAAPLVPNDQLVGLVPGGGILERDLPTLDTGETNLLVTLHEPDFTTAYRLSRAINDMFTSPIAQAQDAGSIVVQVPQDYTQSNDLIRFIAEMETVTFVPDEEAKVVINERTGTIVAGANVSLSPVAIMHGVLSLQIGPGQEQQAQQQQPQQQDQQQAAPGVPGAAGAAGGDEITGDRFVALDQSSNVGEVAQALNLLEVTPRDLISIFQALKRSGSLRADLIIM